MLALAFTFTSCSSEEEETPAPTDMRDQSVGSYTGNIVYEVPMSSEPTSFTIAKGSAESTLALDWSGTVIRCQKVVAMNNGIVLDMVEYSKIIDGDYYTYKGSSRLDLEGVFYDGQYDNNTNKFTVYIDVYKNGTFLKYGYLIGTKI